MSVDKLYQSRTGRFLMKMFQMTGAFRFGAWYLKTGFSRIHIQGYIRKNQVDMSEFKGMEFRSFADFFSRRRNCPPLETPSCIMISPCDGLLSVYPIDLGLSIPMKNSFYRVEDIIPEESMANRFHGGLCLVFRLQAKDYHHFCAFDTLLQASPQFLPGLLHSVQPIASETYPVYRLNRRWWSVLYTENFGTAIQAEVGAMMVGGVSFLKESGSFRKGEEMGFFELAGSTIVLLLDASVRSRLQFDARYLPAMNGQKEVSVAYGRKLGVLKTESNCDEIK